MMTGLRHSFNGLTNIEEDIKTLEGNFEDTIWMYSQNVKELLCDLGVQLAGVCARCTHGSCAGSMYETDRGISGRIGRLMFTK